jgi:hypothetical protein
MQTMLPSPRRQHGLFILYNFFRKISSKLYKTMGLTIKRPGGTIVPYSELNIFRKELCTMTRFHRFERSFGTSAQCAEASSCCASLNAVTGTVFAVSVFVMSVLALRLQGLMLIALISIIISSIIISRKSNLLERTERLTA